ncbi:MAG: deoxynucleoside kinase [Nanoarchaeota archaeon]
MKQFICVAGNIGSGKTTVANLLSQVFSLRKFEEEVEDNPYLALFYADMHKWSYRLQRYFLLTRALMHEKINMMKESAILDRTIYEDMEVFAKNQLYMQLWTQEEYDKYKKFCSLLITELRPPDLIICLHASVPILRARIRKRNREYEKDLTNEDDQYLPALQKLYDSWFTAYNLGPKLLVKTDSLNFIDNPEHIERLIKAVKASLEARGNTLKKFF